MTSRRVARAVSRARRSSRRPSLLSGGRGDGLHPRDIPRRDLEQGTTIELEHTDDEGLALEIALDHLAEDPNYYRKLRRAKL